MPYTIGEKIYFKGNEAIICEEPYALHGAWWQDAVTVGHNKLITVPTPEQEEENIRKQKEEWNKQQAAFRRMKSV